MTSGVKVRWLVAVIAISLGLSWLLLTWLDGNGQPPSTVTWPVHAALAVISIWVLVAGWGVRSYLRGKRPSMDGLRAARTVVFAQAAALTGAGLAGWYGAHVLMVMGDLQIEPRRDQALAAGAAVLLSIGIAVVGMVVQRWCKMSSPHDDDDPGLDARDGSPA